VDVDNCVHRWGRSWCHVLDCAGHPGRPTAEEQVPAVHHGASCIVYRDGQPSCRVFRPTAATAYAELNSRPLECQQGILRSIGATRHIDLYSSYRRSWGSKPGPCRSSVCHETVRPDRAARSLGWWASWNGRASERRLAACVTRPPALRELKDCVHECRFWTSNHPDDEASYRRQKVPTARALKARPWWERASAAVMCQVRWTLR